MKGKFLKKAGLSAAALIMAFGLAACGNSNNKSESTVSNNNSESTATNSGEGNNAAKDPYTLTFFTNNSDRSVGQGKLEQDLIDQYVKENPNVKIKVETLSPDSQYQDKIKIYNASGELPDIISSWGSSAFLKPLVDSGALAEIDRSTLADAGFVEGSLESFTFGDKLYGFPRNSDFWVIYYNKKIFADNDIQVPTTEADLLKAIDVLEAKKIIPIAMSGRDTWTSSLWLDTMLQRVAGNWDVAKNGNFDDPVTVAAATAMQRWIDAGAFGTGFLSQDYGAARNMFGQGKAAMFMMGEWEMGMASDTNFPDDVRNNIGAFTFPTLEGGKGTTSDLGAWFGGGYSVSNKSEHKAEAIQFLTWMFEPENWAKGVWQNGITFPAQKYDQFMTGQETPVQEDLSKIFNNASSYSGIFAHDTFTADATKLFEDAIQMLEIGKINPSEFSKAIADATKKSVDGSK